jgi:hypothetical protein
MTSDTSTDDDTRVDTAAAQGGFSSLFLAAISTTHILRSDFLPEPGDLGRLRAVSRGMRDAVDATGREIKKLSDDEALDLGYVSLLKDRHSRGLLSAYRYHFPCTAAARNGDLQELKALRADEWPWNQWTCAHAAKGGHLEVLKWAARERLPVGRVDVHVRGGARPPRDAEVGARERLPVERGDVLVRGVQRPPRDAEVGAQERLPVGLVDVRVRGEGWSPRNSEVDA